VCPDKPIFNAESPLNLIAKGTSKKELLKDDLIKQHNQWKFYDGTTKLPGDWNKSDADTSKWKSISVPGMWGKQGFNKCKVGLYQKEFTISPELLKSGKTVYLNGKALSDSSIIYLNGIEIGLTKRYNEAFSFNVTNKLQKRNVLAIKIVNNYV
jgi:beta-galactosidase/beta-glucuronidase